MFMMVDTKGLGGQGIPKTHRVAEGSRVDSDVI